MSQSKKKKCPKCGGQLSQLVATNLKTADGKAVRYEGCPGDCSGKTRADIAAALRIVGLVLALILGVASSASHAQVISAGGKCRNASATQSGCVSTGTQVLGGAKTLATPTFTGNVTMTGTAFVNTVLTNTGVPLDLRGQQANGAGTIAVKLGSQTAYSTDGAAIASIENNFVQKAKVRLDGAYQPSGVATGSLAVCDAAHQGSYNFDTTTTTPKTCFDPTGGGTGGFRHYGPSSGTFAAYYDGGPATGVDFARRAAAGDGAYVGIAGTVTVAGVGAGTFAVQVWTAPGGTGSMLCDLGATACTSTAGTNLAGTCGTGVSAYTVASGHYLVVTYAGGGCSTNPKLNVGATFFGG